MRAQQFLDLLEQKELLSEALVAKLREQIAAAGVDYSAEAIAEQLVSKGRLTADQADRLLNRPPVAEDDNDLTLDLPTNNKHDVDEPLRLAPLDDPPPLAPPKVKEKVSLSASNPLDDLLQSSLTSDPLFADPLALAGDPMLAAPPAAGKRKKDKRDRSKSQWDTPLILVGGGGLVFLILAGITLLYFINRGSGDQQLQVADEFYRQGSYTQAIANYDAFLKDYATHPSASSARVQRGMARLRQATDGTTNFEGALDRAQQVLSEIENEPEFRAARDELRAMLPTIAEGLAEQARTAEERETTERLVERAKEALVLIANTKYIPHSLRPGERIAQIEGILSVVTRDLQRDEQLQDALSQIDQLADAGKTTEAYVVRRALLDAYPDLRDDATLHAAATRISQAEAQNVQVADEPRTAFTEEAPSPLVAALAVAHRRGSAAPGIASEPIFVHAQGAVYGLDLADGRLLWRRWLGSDPSSQPVAIGEGAGRDVLVIHASRDANQNELARLAGDSGKLRWRLPLGERLLPPVLDRNQAFVATHAGKIWAVDVESGSAPRHAVIAQELHLPPTIDARAKCLYQIGQHSNLYVLSTETLACQEVLYLGHEAGTVAVSPVLAGQNLLVVENWGTQDATLHVVRRDAEGRSLQPVQQIRLRGHVLIPPRVAGRQVVVTTDRGEIQVFEISTSTDKQPLIPIATQAAGTGEPLLRYTQLHNGRVWVADRQLTQFAIHSASARLVPQPVESLDKGDIFDGPMQRHGELLVHLRRRARATGLTVAAVDMKNGRRLWEIDLAMPPAAEPVSNAARRELSLVTTSGAVYRFDSAAIKAGAQDEPLPVANSNASPAPLAGRVELAENRFVYIPAAGGQTCLVLDSSAAQQPARWLTLPAALAAAPVAWNDGLLTPLQSGQVALLDPATGKPTVEPFQPRLEPGQPIAWGTPGVSESGKEVIVADRAMRFYRLAIEPQPKPHLKAAATSTELMQPITSPVAVQGNLVLAVDASGMLVRLSLDELKLVEEMVSLSGQAIWGPQRVGSLVLLVSEQEELIAINAEGSVAWRHPLEHGLLAGTPLVHEKSLVYATREGMLVQVDLSTGETQSTRELGQPLASGPVVFGSYLVLAGHDATLLVTRLPEEK